MFEFIVLFSYTRLALHIVIPSNFLKILSLNILCYLSYFYSGLQLVFSKFSKVLQIYSMFLKAHIFGLFLV